MTGRQMNKSLAQGLVIILLIPYSLFLFEFVAKDVTFRNIVKVVASVFGPVPLAIFFAYVFVAKKNIFKEVEETLITTLTSFNYLFISLLISVIFLYFLEVFIYKDFSETVVPIFINSLILMMYITNILYVKSIQMIAILSGMSMGISIHVLFLG
jgi:hypothetical protein